MKKENGPGLVIIDMQEGFNDPFWGKRNNEHLENNVERILANWRQRHLPVFHVQHLSKNPQSPLHKSHPGVAIMSCAKPLEHETIIQKSVNSCFIGTGLELLLKDQKINTLVFVGIASDHCVSTSARMAANLGFRCYVASDGTTAFDRKGCDGTLHPGELIHATSLASLHGEFATVLPTNILLEMDFSNES